MTCFHIGDVLFHKCRPYFLLYAILYSTYLHLFLYSYIYILYLEYWTSPLKKGDKRPPPLGGHRIAKFDGYRAVLFGGKGPPEHVVNERNNGAWILDLVNMVTEHIFRLHIIIV